MGASAPLLTAGITYLAGGAGATGAGAGLAGLMGGLGSALPVGAALALPVMYAISPKFRKKYHGVFRGMKEGIFDTFENFQDGWMDSAGGFPDTDGEMQSNNPLRSQIEQAQQRQRSSSQEEKLSNSLSSGGGYDSFSNPYGMMADLGYLLPDIHTNVQFGPPAQPTFGNRGLASLQNQKERFYLNWMRQQQPQRPQLPQVGYF